jgi:hypothetical protein
MTNIDAALESLKALSDFVQKYPTWWWKIGFCDRSRDFTAAPQSHSPEIIYATIGNQFDGGFTCDHEGTIADAILQVMADIEEAIAEGLKNHPLPEENPPPRVRRI